MNDYRFTYRDWDQYLIGFPVDKDQAGVAANKPLLLLHVLACGLRGKPNLFRFREIEPIIREGRRRFGRKTTPTELGPHAAFWQLHAEGCWLILEPQTLPLGRYDKRPTLRTFRTMDVCATVPERLWGQLADQTVVRGLFERVLGYAFDPSEHGDIREWAGVSG